MITLTEAKEVTKAIVDQLDPMAVVLFGSMARRGKGDDLDLLIVSGGDESVSEVQLLHQCLKTFYKRFSIDPILVSVADLRRFYREGSPFVRLILMEGRSLYMKKAVKEWLGHAEEELSTAEYLFDGGFYRSACYHAQQAIEKGIKARLIEKGWLLEKIHSLERLISIAEDYEVAVSMADDEITFMDTIYLGRYPAEAGLLPLGDPKKEDAERAVSIAGRIVSEYL